MFIRRNQTKTGGTRQKRETYSAGNQASICCKFVSKFIYNNRTKDENKLLINKEWKIFLSIKFALEIKKTNKENTTKSAGGRIREF